MRIRKRSLPATFFGKPGLNHESSNGDLHLHAGSKSNPSFQDPRSSLLSPASIIMQDHFLLPGCGYGATHRLSQRQVPAEAISLERKPYNVVLSGVDSCDDGKGLIMKRGEGNPRAKSVMDVQHHEVKHMHMHDGEDNIYENGMDMKGCKQLGLPGTSGEGHKSAESCSKKARHDIACKGSAFHEEINVHTDPAMINASDYPRKVRPLQLILSSDYSPTARKLLLSPTSSSSTMSCTPPSLPRKFDELALPCVPTNASLSLPSPAAGLLIKQISDVDEMRHEDDASRNLVENQAELESCDGPVSTSWQGHRRPRSHLQGGRGFNGASGVNAVFKPETTHPTELHQRKKLKQTKRKAIHILVRPRISVQPPTTTSPATSAGNGQLRNHADFFAAPKNNAHTKKPKSMPPVSLSPSVLPTSSKSMIGSLDAAARLLEAQSADDDHIDSVAPAPGATASDYGLDLDSMRCRRKDGRRWRCKEQVVKPGAPFCHYHTLKMREKHAASHVARKLLKQLQSEVKINLRYADVIRSSNKRANNSSPAVQDGDGGGCTGAADEEDHENEEENHEVYKEEKIDNDDEEQEIYAQLAKQQLQESLKLRRRWRKKCKPCIRRLHDIHDRARPAATDGLDFFSPCADTHKESPPVRSRSPLPECILNTDPYEWRSDFP